MWWSLVTGWLLVCGASAEDSLRPALHALQKRQRDLAPPPPLYYTRNNLIYGDGQPEDIGYGYQKSAPGTSGVFETIAIPYSELGASYDPETSLALSRLLQDAEDMPTSAEKRTSVFREREDEPDDTPAYLVPSSFRERMNAEKIPQRTASSRNYQNLARNSENEISDDDYINILNSIWEKYKGETDPEELTEADVEELLEYLANKEERKRPYGSYDTGYDFFNSPLSWNKRSLRNEGHHKRYQETLFDDRYPYRGLQKRYPITKRSPSSINTNAVTHRHKKNTPEKQTDPKVAAELSNIFSEEKKDKKNITHAQAITTVATSGPNTTQATGQKEQTIDVNALKPLDVKKKSINWSDYFGIDRRKKSTPDNKNVNSDWLLRKYLEAYGVGKNQDSSIQEKHSPPRVDDVDSKMKAMEDLIVDQAIKYTGAHEGTTDSNEIQEVKDKVIAQLAAAYSLEKMRRALGEFKASLAAQKAYSPASHPPSGPKNAEPEYKPKRVLKEKLEEQGKVKMEKKDSDEESNEIDFGTLGERDCPVLRGVERRCKQVSRLTGDVNEVFVPLCNLHSMCYLCGPALRAASPRECDTAFREEADVLCRDDIRCLYLAGKTLATSRSLEKDPELVCDWRNSPCLARFLAISNEKR